MAYCLTRTTRVTGTPAERLVVFRDLAREAATDPEVIARARTIRARVGRGREVAAALAYVQTFPLRADPPPGGNTVCDPLSTELLGGACVPRSIYLGALYLVLGYEVDLVWLPQPYATRDHVLLCVQVDGVWQWADPTLPRAPLGAHPWSVTQGWVS